MEFISFFAGIGGFDLGFERAGMECVAQIEIDEFCQKVLAKHWPNVPKFGDIRDVGKHNLPAADLICGGFPCQSVSLIGQRRLIDDERWMWPELFRIICEIRPKYIVLENVPGLLSGGGMSNILGDLASSGYDAEWQVLPAKAIGAPHRRERVFIVAHPARISGWKALEQGNALSKSRKAWESNTNLGWREMATFDWVLPESYITREIDGIPRRLERDRALGNAVVPQVAEFIGRAIMEVASISAMSF